MAEIAAAIDNQTRRYTAETARTAIVRPTGGGPYSTVEVRTTGSSTSVVPRLRTFTVPRKLHSSMTIEPIEPEGDR